MQNKKRINIFRIINADFVIICNIKKIINNNPAIIIKIILFRVRVGSQFCSYLILVKINKINIKMKIRFFKTNIVILPFKKLF